MPASSVVRQVAWTHSSRWCFVWMLLSIHLCHLVYLASTNSPIMNEPAQLIGGLNTWELGRFDLYRENPPLLRTLAAIPVLTLPYQEDWDRATEYPGARPVYLIAQRFVGRHGRWVFDYIHAARLACIPFAVIGLLATAFWSRELFGNVASLLSATLWCFCPMILGHGHLIMTDVSTASLSVLATYLFWRWLRRPGWTRAIFAGVALGLALLSKFTVLALFPIWGSVWLVDYVQRRSLGVDGASLRQLVSSFGVAIYVLNAGYLFDGTGTPLGDLQFASRRLSGEEWEPFTEDRQGGNRWRDHLLGRLPIPVPRQYLLGMDIQQRDFEHFGDVPYLCGEFREGGWWYYYPYALVVKSTLGTLGLIAFVVAARCFRPAPVPLVDELLLLLPIGVWIVGASATGFCHHSRYLIPVLPFLFVWLGQAVLLARGMFSRVIVGSLLAASVLSTCIAYPNMLGYFNELVGGVAHGHKHLIDSNIDWGQDLFRLQEWQAETNPGPIYLAYYGPVNPKDAGIDYRPFEEGFSGEGAPAPGIYAISTNLLVGMRSGIHHPSGRQYSLSPAVFEWFRNRKSDELIGSSIHIFRVGEVKSHGNR